MADCGSFSKASERLFITHTAVIKQISGLESRLGVKLFIRSSRGVAMTPAGQCLYGELLMIMEKGNSPVNDEIRRTILETCGEIRLTDTPPHYNIKTFNSCAEKGCLLFSLECWKDIHPSLVSVPLEEPFFLPYGIVASAKPSETVRGFLEEMRNILLTVHGAGKIG